MQIPVGSQVDRDFLSNRCCAATIENKRIQSKVKINKNNYLQIAGIL